ncbi:MAG: dioxygenase [Polyangiaceae bacterium]|nr:dioxygenase [Polyangiaceae bacterium]
MGLGHDLKVLALGVTRRRMLAWGGGASLAAAFGCGQGGFDDAEGGGGAGGSDSGGACQSIPEETAGPYPGDGSNGPNALSLSGIVRSDIRASVAGATGVAGGVALTVKLVVVDSANGCAPLAGHAVYLWHCDRDGNYSMYSTAVAGENYLRGVQETDEDGTVTFTTVFPGCYVGRWPHIHFEVYSSLDDATDATDKVATSQLAFPEDACADAYETAGYEASVDALAGVSLESDNVFGDGATLQLATISGDATNGFVATLTVAV